MTKGWYVTLRGAFVLMLAGWQVIRFWSALQYAEVLRQYAPVPGPGYIAFTGLVWALVLGLAAWGSLRPNSRYGLPLLPTVSAYLAWFWLDRLFLQYHTPPGGSNRFFLLLLQGLLLAFFWCEQFFEEKSEKNKRKESENRERQPQDQEIA